MAVAEFLFLNSIRGRSNSSSNWCVAEEVTAMILDVSGGCVAKIISSRREVGFILYAMSMALWRDVS